MAEKHEKFDQWLKAAREFADVFAPPLTLLCVVCSGSVVLTGYNTDKTHGFLECEDCGYCVCVKLKMSL